MSRIKKKFIRLGTGTDELNARDVSANFTPSNYTPTQVASEGADKISAHLKGIDTSLGAVSNPYDLASTAFSGANNVSSATNVTGFAFANASVGSFKALVHIRVDATSDLFEVVEIMGIQKASSWEISQSYTGDDSLVDFTITTAGQIQYTSANYSGFSSLTIRFRAWTNQL